MLRMSFYVYSDYDSVTSRSTVYYTVVSIVVGVLLWFFSQSNMQVDPPMTLCDLTGIVALADYLQLDFSSYLKNRQQAPAVAGGQTTGTGHAFPFGRNSLL